MNRIKPSKLRKILWKVMLSNKFTRKAPPMVWIENGVKYTICNPEWKINLRKCGS